jgi:protein-tyrosine kinase
MTPDSGIRSGSVRLNFTRKAPPPQIEFIEHTNSVTPGEQLLIAHDPYAPHCEKIRALRTELLVRRESSDHADVLALLSPCAGEGRSQLAAELAISFAQLGRPTLLVDADLRHPQQHVLFGADNRHGLSQAIRTGKEPVPYSVRGLPGLSLITAGPLQPNPLELLLSTRFEWLMEVWRRNYDFVILDTAPLQQYSDGIAVATFAGRVLVLNRAQHTPYPDTRDLLFRLAATQSRIVGAVLNHF